MQSINREYSEKSYIVAVCLVGIFGTLGFHHFYVNRWFHGLFDLSLAVLTIAFLSQRVVGIVIYHLSLRYIHRLTIE